MGMISSRGSVPCFARAASSQGFPFSLFCKYKFTRRALKKYFELRKNYRIFHIIAPIFSKETFYIDTWINQITYVVEGDLVF